MLEQRVRRMLKDPRSEALSINFAGQWLNLRGMQSVGPLPMLYLDFDDPLRQAMRREVELFFDSVMREDRNVLNLLDADYTFVNERLARHYGIADCVQCHRMMDPIGFALENFNAIGIWRSQDEGNTIDSSAELVDGSNVNGPADLRKVMMGYSDQFVRVITEKLLTYALGRGADYHDMPLVRSVVRDAARKNYQFSSIVLGIVKSAPFQTNLKVQP